MISYQSIKDNYSFRRGFGWVFGVIVIILVVNLVSIPGQVQVPDTVENSSSSDLLLNSAGVDETLVLNQNGNDELFGVQFTGIKFSLEKYAGFMVYEPLRSFTFDQQEAYSNQYALVSDYITVNSETVEMRMLDVEGRPNNTMTVTVTQYKMKENTNETLERYDIDEYEKTLKFRPYENVLYAGATINFRQARDYDFVEVLMETGQETKLRWKFNHTTLEQNLLDKAQTVSERLWNNIQFSFLSIVGFAVASGFGVQIGKKAKRLVGIPDGLGYIIAFSFSFLWYIFEQLVTYYQTAIYVYGGVIVLMGSIFGALIYRGKYDTIMTKEFDNNENDHIFTEYEVYFESVQIKMESGETRTKTKKCLLLTEKHTNRPLWETFRRLLGIHRYVSYSGEIEVVETYSLDDSHGELIETESKGFKKGSWLFGSTEFEIVVSDEHRKYRRNIFDKRKKVENLESLYQMMNERNAENIASMRTSFRTQLAYTLQAILEHIGEEYFMTSRGRISDELLQEYGISREELEAESKKPKSERDKGIKSKLKFWE